MRVLIVGAGMAGLAVTIALSRIGMTCHLIDKAFRPLGANIAFNAQAVRALKALGLLEQIVAHGNVIDDLPFAMSLDQAGNRIAASRPKPPTLAEYPACVAISRSNLANIMLSVASDLGAQIDFNLALADLRQESTECVEAHFSNGGNQSYDLVIGADGIHSTTRDLIFGDLPFHDPYVSINRWMLEDSSRIVPGLYINSAGDSIAVVTTSNQTTYVASTFETLANYQPTEEEGFIELQRSFARYSAPTFRILEERLEPKSSILVHPLRALLVEDPWYVGRILLIGDAAHTVFPHLAYGGALAIEDAVVLAEEASEGGNIDNVLQSFMKRRWSRVQQVDSLCRQIVEGQKARMAAADLADLRNLGADLVYSSY